ncbi:MAG: MarR family transcriptional regulator [Nonomuraea muscovyensis]|jgi:predicted transcriptional regulator|nr:MarR family transcriptional regulator [Nonomuraea muscovyensis]
MGKSTDDRPRWTFLTNHARVLLEIARDPQVRMRDIAAVIGITERAAQGIVTDLKEAGYLDPVRVGRRNHYTIDAGQGFRHPTEANVPVRVLIDMFTHRDRTGTAAERTGAADRTTEDQTT